MYILFSNFIVVFFIYIRFILYFILYFYLLILVDLIWVLSIPQVKLKENEKHCLHCSLKKCTLKKTTFVLIVLVLVNKNN